MRTLVQEKAKAITLRKKGLTYRDILKEVDVAKSSISLWLKDMPLTESEKYVLKRRTDANISKGRIRAAASLSELRLGREAVWLAEAKETFCQYGHHPYFHAGVLLYWAEGSKRSTQWSFINSDDEVIKVMVGWLERYASTSRDNLRFRLYIHKLYAHENCEKWWQEKLMVPTAQFSRTIYKPSGRGIKKRPMYKGCLRIEVPKSKGLLMKMKFWQSMLVDSYSKE